MDYSKLSTEDLLALKAGDYSKVSTEGLMAIKGQSAPVQQPSKLEKAVDIAETVKKPFKAVGDYIGEKLEPGMNVATKALQGTIPGMGLQAMQIGTEAFDKGGELAAEKLATGTYMAPGQRIQLPPEAAAAVGTGIAMFPDLVAGGQGILARQAIAQGIKQTGSLAGRGLKSVVPNPLRRMAEVLTGPGEAAQNLKGVQMLNPAQAEIAAAQEATAATKQIPAPLAQAKAELPLLKDRMGQVQKQRAGLLKKSGENIEALEADLGPIQTRKLKQVLDNPETLQATLDDFTTLAAKGPEAIRKVMTAQDIRFARQLLQEHGRNPAIKLDQVQAGRLNKAFGEAMEGYKPGYKDAVEMYKTTKEALDDMPNVRTKEFAELRSKISQMETNFKNTKLKATDAVRKAQLNARQIKAKVDEMVAKGRLSDEARKKLIYAVLGTGMLGSGAAALIK